MKVRAQDPSARRGVQRCSSRSLGTSGRKSRLRVAFRPAKVHTKRPLLRGKKGDGQLFGCTHLFSAGESICSWSRAIFKVSDTQRVTWPNSSTTGRKSVFNGTEQKGDEHRIRGGPLRQWTVVARTARPLGPGGSMTPDWLVLEKLLIDSSEDAIRRFVASLKQRKLLAIGYVFELGNSSPHFDLCANVSGGREFVDDFEDDDRWNSGDYEYPAGLLDSESELGDEWNAANEKLHAIARDEHSFLDIYNGIVRISCDSLIDLAIRGVLPSPLSLDYNVSEVGDDLSLVASRHTLILNAIRVANN